MNSSDGYLQTCTMNWHERDQLVDTQQDTRVCFIASWFHVEVCLSLEVPQGTGDAEALPFTPGGAVDLR